MIRGSIGPDATGVKRYLQVGDYEGSADVPGNRCTLERPAAVVDALRDTTGGPLS
jgi:hypothetical protein